MRPGPPALTKQFPPSLVVKPARGWVVGWALGSDSVSNTNPLPRLTKKIHVENRLLLKPQLLGFRVRLLVEIGLEEGVGIFEKGVEVEVMVKAKAMQEIFSVKINLVEPGYDIGLSLMKEPQVMNLTSRVEREVVSRTFYRVLLWTKNCINIDLFICSSLIGGYCIWCKHSGQPGLCRIDLGRFLRSGVDSGLPTSICGMMIGEPVTGNPLALVMYVDYGNKRAPAHYLVVSTHSEVYIYPHLPLVRRIVRKSLHEMKVLCITPS